VKDSIALLEGHSPAERELLYRQRVHRYVTAMRNERPDRVPIRPLLAEFCGKIGGFDAMQQAHDFRLAFEAVYRTARILDCDALVGNMVYVWTGLTQALGLKYYCIPGIDGKAAHGFQYIEPPDDRAWMRPEEYDHLIEDPTGYLYGVWLPRISGEVVAPGQPATFRNQFALVKSALAMLYYFHSFGAHGQRLRTDCAMPGALMGTLKAPLDILADKLRGYMGLVMDLQERPEKVLAACQALAPHLYHAAVTAADPQGYLPIGFWMHRSCVPFITPEHFRDIHWPTLKPIIENLWSAGHQTLFYAEGNYDAHLEAFAELPERSIVFHVDQGDVLRAHEVLGKRFCISGGVPNMSLAYGTPEEVREHCRRILSAVAEDGGYIMDANAIVQEDARLENIQAMIDATREFGDYGTDPQDTPPVAPAADAPYRAEPMTPWHTARPPGACFPWAEKRLEIPHIECHDDMVEEIWNNIEGFGHMFIWQILVTF
jgi:hypothetical protein